MRNVVKELTTKIEVKVEEQYQNQDAKVAEN